MGELSTWITIINCFFILAVITAVAILFSIRKRMNERKERVAGTVLFSTENVSFIDDEITAIISELDDAFEDIQSDAKVKEIPTFRHLTIERN